MSTTRKVVLILATVLVLGGCALCFGAFASADFRLENLSNVPRDWTESTDVLDAESAAPHRAIVVKSDGDVRLEPTTSDAFEVSYWSGTGKDVTVSDADGVLTVTSTVQPDRGIMIMAFDFTDHTTVVKVPASFAGDVLVEVGAGTVYAGDLPGLGDVTLAASSGQVEAVRLGAESIDLRSSVGGVTALQLRAAAVRATTESGELSLYDVTATDAIVTSSSIGGQQLSLLDAPRIDGRTSSGGIQATGLAGDDISLETSVGDIEATVVGSESEYRIDAAASVGDVHAPHGSADADKRLLLRASSGSIDLGFTPTSPDADAAGGRDAPAPSSGNDGAPSAPAAPSAPDAPAAPTAPGATAGRAN